MKKAMTGKAIIDATAHSRFGSGLAHKPSRRIRDLIGCLKQDGVRCVLVATLANECRRTCGVMSSGRSPTSSRNIRLKNPADKCRHQDGGSPVVRTCPKDLDGAMGQRAHGASDLGVAQGRCPASKIHIGLRSVRASPLRQPVNARNRVTAGIAGQSSDERMARADGCIFSIHKATFPLAVSEPFDSPDGVVRPHLVFDGPLEDRSQPADSSRCRWLAGIACNIEHELFDVVLSGDHADNNEQS